MTPDYAKLADAIDERLHDSAPPARTAIIAEILGSALRAAREAGIEETAKMHDTWAVDCEHKMNTADEFSKDPEVMHIIYNGWYIQREYHVASAKLLRALATPAAEDKVERRIPDGPPCPTCGFRIRTKAKPPFVLDDDDTALATPAKGEQ